MLRCVQDGWLATVAPKGMMDLGMVGAVTEVSTEFVKRSKANKTRRHQQEKILKTGTSR